MGVDSDHARSVLAKLDAPLVRTGKPVLCMDVASAMLAARVAFTSETALVCEERAGVDDVRRGVGSDARIGPASLRPGPGYGDSCRPKDRKALWRTAKDVGVPPSVAAAVDRANERQKLAGGRDSYSPDRLASLGFACVALGRAPARTPAARSRPSALRPANATP